MKEPRDLGYLNFTLILLPFLIPVKLQFFNSIVEFFSFLYAQVQSAPQYQMQKKQQTLYGKNAW